MVALAAFVVTSLLTSCALNSSLCCWRGWLLGMPPLPSGAADGKGLVPETPAETEAARTAPVQGRRGEVMPRPKGTVLSWAPRIFQFDGVLTARECDAIAERALGRMEHVGTFSNPGVLPQERLIRTSSSMWFSSDEDDRDDLVASVRQALLDLVLVPSAHAESLQVTRYEEGQYYDLHYDFSQPGRDRVDPARYPHGDVERAATIIAYLSDGFEGGETVFPRVARRFRAGAGGIPKGLLRSVPAWSDSVWPSVEGGLDAFCADGGSDALRVKPAKGSVIVFYGYGADGMRDMDTIHGSCAVRSGVKVIAQQWVQMNIRYASKQTLEDRGARLVGEAGGLGTLQAGLVGEAGGLGTLQANRPDAGMSMQRRADAGEHAASDAAERMAIATLVSTREYALGAVVLARTLMATTRAVKSGEIALVALVPPHGVGGTEVSAQEARWMELAGWRVRRVECLVHVEGSSRSFLRPDLASVSYSKLHLWALHEDYDRVLFIDADAFVTGDVGFLIRDDAHWVQRGTGKKMAINGVEEVNGQVKTGLFGIRPSKKLHRRLMRSLHRTDINFTNNEQGLVTKVLEREWSSVPREQRMPGDEHLCSGACGMRLPVWGVQVSRARVVDFQGLSKPWVWPQSIAKQECQVMVVFALLWQALLFAPFSPRGNTKDVRHVLEVFSSVRRHLVSPEGFVDAAGVQRVAASIHGLVMEMVERIGALFFFLVVWCTLEHILHLGVL